MWRWSSRRSTVDSPRANRRVASLPAVGPPCIVPTAAWRSLRIACNKRPISIEILDEIVGQVERGLAEAGDREVSSQAIGQVVMEALKRTDEVAYVRFASVYKSFRDIDAFMLEMSQLVRDRSKG